MDVDIFSYVHPVVHTCIRLRQTFLHTLWTTCLRTKLRYKQNYLASIISRHLVIETQNDSMFYWISFTCIHTQFIISCRKNIKHFYRKNIIIYINYLMTYVAQGCIFLIFNCRHFKCKITKKYKNKQIGAVANVVPYAIQGSLLFVSE